MTSFRSASGELRRLVSARPFRVASLVICLVPLLYGVLYLWAFWDPYQRLDKLPVAVVNLDTPVRSADRTVSGGADLVTQLQHSDAFDWHVVSSTEATDGLGAGRYSMALTIPADFSASLASSAGPRPRQAVLRVQAQEGRNLLATQIGGRVFTEVKDSLAAVCSQRALARVFIGLTGIHDGLKTGGRGAGRLAGGLHRATSGSAQLTTGLDGAASGSATLSGGLASLCSGSRTLASGSWRVAGGATRLAGGVKTAARGADTLAAGSKSLAGGSASLVDGLGTLTGKAQQLSAAAGDLHQGAGAVTAGAAQLLDQVTAAASGAERLSAAATQVRQALTAYAAAHPEAADDATFKAALDGQQQLEDGLGRLSTSISAGLPDARRLAAGATGLETGLGQLADGQAAFHTGIAQATSSAQTVADGAGDLSRSAGSLDAGLTSARTGAADLAGGSRRVADGAGRLAAGAVSARRGAGALQAGLVSLRSGGTTLGAGLLRLTTGADKLSAALTASAARLPAYGRQARRTHAAVLAAPVALETQRLDPVPNYGTGFAPYFIPLALWVGALMTFFLVRPLSGRALASTLSDTEVALAGLWPAVVIVALQAVILIAVLMLTLGLDPVQPLALFAFTLLSAFTFVTILQWLSAALGTSGKLVAVVLLMLQLTSSAGTFPLQTAPRFFQVINPYLPMTYVVEGLRQVISGGDLTLVARDAAILAGFALAGIGATTLTAHRRRLWTMDRLRPLPGV